MLSDRERYIVLFLHAVHSDADNKTAFAKMEKYANILNLQITNDESVQLMQDLDEVLLDIIDLEGNHLSNLQKLKESQKK